MNTQTTFIDRLLSQLGLAATSTSNTEKFLSGLGAMLGVTCIYFWTYWIAEGFDHDQGIDGLASYVAASAVLLFAVPHGALSQPWPVFGGYLVSALVGIGFHHFLGENSVAGPLAVGVAVLGMYYLRCLHPPGGAVALWAVTGLGTGEIASYETVMTFALGSAGVLIMAAVIFNRLFPWRRYPASKASRPHSNAEVAHCRPTEADFAAALQELNSFMDITPEDLCSLFELAQDHALANKPNH